MNCFVAFLVPHRPFFNGLKISRKEGRKDGIVLFCVSNALGVLQTEIRKQVHFEGGRR